MDFCVNTSKENRLIDVDEARRIIIAFATGLHSEVLSIDTVMMLLIHMPTVDAVEVVRCEDCTNYMNDTAYCKKHDKGYCCLDDVIKTKNHYCGYAERKK